MSKIKPRTHMTMMYWWNIEYTKLLNLGHAPVFASKILIDYMESNDMFDSLEWEKEK